MSKNENRKEITINFFVGFVYTIFGISVLTSSLIPLYYDELAYKAMNARLIQDGLSVINLDPQCGLKTTQEVPFFFYIPKVFLSTIYLLFENPLMIRALGILFFLLNMFILLKIMKEKNYQIWETKIGKCFVISLFFLGALSQAMTLNRPEQLLFFMSLYCWYGVIVSSKLESQSVLAKLAFFGGFVYIWIYALSEHAKALYFIFPAIFFCLSVPSKKFVKVVLTITVLITWLSTYRFNSGLSCDGMPLLQKFVSSFFIKPSEAIHWPMREILARLKTSLDFSPFIKNIFLQSSYQSGWLPLHKELSSFDKILNFGIGGIFLGISLTPPILLLLGLSNSIKKIRVSKEVLFLITLYCTFITFSYFTVLTNFYESAIRLPILIISFLITWSLRPSAFRFRYARYGMVFVICIACLGQIDLSYLLFSGPTGTNSPYAYNLTKKIVYELAEACHLNLEAKPHQLVVDKFTWPAIWNKTYLPFEAQQIGSFAGMDIKNRHAFLKSFNSEGLVTKCESLPDDLRVDTIERGGFCCHGAY